jgi:hypothetical protein
MISFVVVDLYLDWMTSAKRQCRNDSKHLRTTTSATTNGSNDTAITPSLTGCLTDLFDAVDQACLRDVDDTMVLLR